MSQEGTAAPAGTYRRGTEEFSRVLAFSDGIFAIAMTLLVVGIGLPTLTDAADEGELLSDLRDAFPEVFSFFLSFAVIGRYWVAHHAFFGRLGAVDFRFIWIHLLYLGFIAFLPFPTDLLVQVSLSPVLFFLAAIPVAFLSTTAAVVVWFLFVPFQYLFLEPRRPDGA
jgi:uncharacterized membrane protein